MKIKNLLIATILGTSLCAVLAAELNADFKNPLEATKPWCYWYWLDGDISKEGIPKDLESMAKVGIKRAAGIGRSPQYEK